MKRLALLLALLASTAAAQPALDVTRAALGADGAPQALVVALHPWGSGGRPMVSMVEAAAIPCAHLVLAPDGPLPHAQGHAWLRHPVAHDANQAALRADALVGAGGVAAILRRERERGQRVVVTGISQGGVVAYALAARYPGLADVVVAAAGLLPEGFTVRSGDGRVVLVHGERDQFVPVTRARAGLARLRAGGRRTEERVLAGEGHRIRGRLRALYLEELREAVACPER